jgi:ABC-type antimicrobial peptide transport system permease subunit
VFGLAFGTAVAILVDRATGGATLGDAAPGLVAFVAVIMLTAGTVAAWGPARLALRIQPMESLRQE